jgi:hypothetical protein
MIKVLLVFLIGWVLPFIGIVSYMIYHTKKEGIYRNKYTQFIVVYSIWGPFSLVFTIVILLSWAGNHVFEKINTKLCSYINSLMKKDTK